MSLRGGHETTERERCAGAPAGAPGTMDQILTAVSMTAGRGRVARLVAGAAGLHRDDVVVDVGCGPGTAVREASRRGASAIGVDPSPVMLRLARWMSRVTRPERARWLEGRAEALPLSGGSASVAWALSSVHHWDDRAAGLQEIHRVLGPGGRVLLIEGLARPGARGHAAHGLTAGQAEDLAKALRTAGFSEVTARTCRAGRRALTMVSGSR